MPHRNESQLPGDTLKIPAWRKIGEITLGILLVILGLIGGLIPVLQGWMFGIPGLLLLARHFQWAQRLVAWAKRKSGLPAAKDENKNT